MSFDRRQFLTAVAAGAAAGAVMGCTSKRPAVAGGPVTVEVYDKALLALIDMAPESEVLGSGYGWSEGPGWDPVRKALYFTDVPGNIAWRWRAGDGVDVLLDPSGAPASETAGFREPGANGLWVQPDGTLILCNHGTRSIERMDVESGARETLTSSYDGKKYNSPNDLFVMADGTIYFTDPPYGLEGMDASPLKEMDANGVYRLNPDGVVTRLVSDMTFPNGVAISPDGKWMYVAQSDPAQPVIRRFALIDSNAVPDDAVFFDGKPYADKGLRGLPDGMALTVDGHLFATGPGGVFVLDPDGKALGRLDPGSASANCAFGGNGRTLFITAHDRLVRVETKALGLAWA